MGLCYVKEPYTFVSLMLKVGPIVPVLFAKIAHKVAKSKYFSKILIKLECPEDSLYNDLNYVYVKSSVLK